VGDFPSSEEAGAASVPQTTVAQDDVLRLREFRLDDAPWYRYLADLGMWRYSAGWAVARMEQAEYLVGQFIEQAAESPRTEFRFVCESHAGERVGFCVISTEMPEVCGVGWFVTPENWGRGLGTRAARLVVGYAFEKAGFYRAQATAHPDNAASLRVIERLGFTYVGYVRDYGIARDHVNLTDEWQDRQMYSMSRYDWTGEAPSEAPFRRIRARDG
jgi:RimJ/RimL family protein N-acetyltransferase